MAIIGGQHSNILEYNWHILFRLFYWILWFGLWILFFLLFFFWISILPPHNYLPPLHSWVSYILFFLLGLVIFLLVKIREEWNLGCNWWFKQDNHKRKRTRKKCMQVEMPVFGTLKESEWILLMVREVFHPGLLNGFFLHIFWVSTFLSGVSWNI